jgi:hypothetical protein
VPAMMKVQEAKVSRMIEMEADLQRIIATGREVNFVGAGVGIIAPADADTEKKTIMGPCPGSGCRGFLSVTSDKHTCGLCGIKVCGKCRAILEKDKEHKCKPEDVQSTELLMKDCKPCPICAVPIMKKDGCAQIWCPQCHTAFDWNSMQVATGRIHTPHYYDYMREKGLLTREAGDQPCGGLPAFYELPAWPIVSSIHRSIVHIQEVTLLEKKRVIWTPALNLQLRVQYIMNEFTLEGLGIKLLLKEKERAVNLEVHNALDLFARVATELLQKMKAVHAADKDPNRNKDAKERGPCVPVLEEINQLRLYVNQRLEKIMRIYDFRLEMLNEEYNLAKQRRLKPKPRKIKNEAEVGAAENGVGLDDADDLGEGEAH